MRPWADKCHQPVPWHFISGRRHRGQAKQPKAELEVASVTWCHTGTLCPSDLLHASLCYPFVPPQVSDVQRQ